MDEARAWIERDKTDPYSGGYVGPLMERLVSEIDRLRDQNKASGDEWNKRYGVLESRLASTYFTRRLASELVGERVDPESRMVFNSLSEVGRQAIAVLIEERDKLREVVSDLYVVVEALRLERVTMDRYLTPEIASEFDRLAPMMAAALAVSSPQNTQDTQLSKPD